MDADYDEPVDLDHLHTGTGNAAVTECSCGTRRSLIRHWEVTPCASRALARLRQAHRPEYDQYLAESRLSVTNRGE